MMGIEHLQQEDEASTLIGGRVAAEGAAGSHMPQEPIKTGCRVNADWEVVIQRQNQREGNQQIAGPYEDPVCAIAVANHQLMNCAGVMFGNDIVPVNGIKRTDRSSDGSCGFEHDHTCRKALVPECRSLVRWL